MSARAFLASLFILIFQLESFTQNEPTISTCEGVQTFCLEAAIFDLCVEITIDPNFTEPIDHFEIDWGDTQPATIIPGSFSPPDQFHSYNFSNFFGTCGYSTMRTIVLYSYLENGDILNNAFIMTVRNPPKAVFNINSPICVGQTLNLTQSSCPMQGLTICPWDYGDGTTGTANSHVYNQAGTYEVTLKVFNVCDTAITTKTVEVLELPQANAQATAGVMNTSADTLVHCLGADTICLDGNTFSLNETSWSWKFLSPINNNCFKWHPQPPSSPFISTVSQPKLTFSCPGIYHLELTVNNPCNLPDKDTLIFQVLAPPVVTIDLLESDCVPITLNPADYLDVTGVYDDCFWQIGSTSTSDNCDPGDFTFTETTQVVFTATNECWSSSDTGFVYITLSGDAEINSPCSDTLCSYDPPCFLTENLTGGLWQINGQSVPNGIFDPSSPPVQPGWNTITYGSPPCITEDEIQIYVINAQVGISGQNLFCIDGPHYNFTGTQTGGVFSGNGIVNPATGEFSPSVAGVGTHTIYYELQFNNGFCSGIDSIEVEVIEVEVGFQVDDCDGTTLFFSLAPNTSSFDNITWSFGDGGTSSASAPSHTYSVAQTYTVSVTIEQDGCEASATDTISVQANPQASFSLVYNPDNCAPLEVQFINESVGDTAQYQWLWDFGNGITSSQHTPSNILFEQGLNDTTYTISLSVAGGCENSQSTETILVQPRPTALFGSDYDQYCSGDTIYLSNNSFGNAETFEWWIEGALISNDSTPPLYVYLTSVTDSVEVCLITTNECGADTLCRQIVVNPTNVEAFFNTDPTPVCVFDTVCFTNFSTFNAGIYYDFGDGNTSSDPNPCHVYEEPGQYKVVLKAFGCGFDSATATVNVLPVPEADFSHNGVVCAGAPLIFTDNSTGAVNYQWDFGDTSVSTLISPSHIYDTPGNYSVSLTVTSQNGCQDITNSTVVVAALPTAGFSFSDPLCAGDQIAFLNASSPDVISCAFDFEDGNNSASCNPAHTFQTPGTYLVSQTVTNNFGCKDTVGLPVLVLTVPDATFDFQYLMSDSCSPSIIQFINGSTNADGYLWDFGDGTTSTETSPIHNYNQPGTYQVTLTAVKDSICENTLSKNLTIFETPLALIILPSDEGCAPFDIDFTSGSTGLIFEYQWGFGDGLVSFEQNPSHTYTAPGVYTISLLVSNDQCQHDTSVSVTVNEPVFFDYALTDILCYGDETGAIDVVVTSGTQPFNFEWSNGSMTEDIAGLFAGNYSLLVTDVNGCTRSETMTLQQPPPLSILVTDEQAVSCFGGSDGLICIEPAGGVPAYSFQWASGSINPCLTNVPAGIYPITVFDANDCILNDTMTVTQNAAIQVVDTFAHVTCFGFGDGSISIETILGGVPIFNNQMTGPNDYNVEGMTFDDLEPGKYSLNVVDAIGCTFSKNYEIIEPDSLWMYIHKDTVFMELGDSYQLDISHNGVQAKFLWSPPDSLNCFDCPEPLAFPVKDTNYQLTLTDGNGCTVSDRVFFKIDKKRGVYIPNVFTPNGDGRNDIFRIRTGVKSIRKVRAFRIFDRWGELIFEAIDFHPNDNNPVNEWDGYFRGERLTPDVFYYYAEIEYVDNFIDTVKGEIMLVR